jgi:hypothetical protein
MPDPSGQQIFAWIKSVQGIELSATRAATLSHEFEKANKLALERVAEVSADDEPGTFWLILSRNAELGG